MPLSTVEKLPLEEVRRGGEVHSDSFLEFVEVFEFLALAEHILSHVVI